MQKLLDSLRGAFGSYLMEASFKQVKFIKSLVKKAPNAFTILTKHNVDADVSHMSAFDDQLNLLSTKEASALIGDLLGDTENSQGAAPVAGGGTPAKTDKWSGVSSSPGGWQNKKASRKQVGYVLSMMAQLGYANWRKSPVAKKYKKPPKTQELMNMPMSEISELINLLKNATASEYA